MEPMSLRTRRLLATVSFFLFAIVLPVATLYASGYRLSGFSLVSTGGIHITTPMSGVTISLNGEEVERSSLFSRSFFFDNLDPGAYVVQTQLDGYAPWSKTLIVESQVVTDIAMLAIPQPLRFIEIVPTATATSTEETATSTMRFVPTKEFFELEEIFNATTTLEALTATTTVDSQNGIELYLENDDLKAVWGRDSSPLSVFCVRPSLCAGEFYIERSPDTVTDARFFKGGVLYRTLESGIFFAEVDVRQPTLLVSVYSTPNSEYQVVNGVLYIRDDETIYEVANF